MEGRGWARGLEEELSELDPQQFGPTVRGFSYGPTLRAQGRGGPPICVPPRLFCQVPGRESWLCEGFRGWWERQARAITSRPLTNDTFIVTERNQARFAVPDIVS